MLKIASPSRAPEQSRATTPTTLVFLASLMMASPAASELKTVDGDGNVKIFSLDDLEALRVYQFETETSWTEAKTHFSGPSLMDVLRVSGMNDCKFRVRALNEYSVNFDSLTVPLTPFYPIIATRIDDERFSVREKGPLWIVYPYDQFEFLRDDLIYAVSVWQVRELSCLEN